MKFILSRTEDIKSHSKLWIVGYALLFWLITRLLAGAIVAVIAALYEYYGFSPEELAQFGSSPDQFANSSRPVWYILCMVLLVVPLLEETVFRLGLSFKRWQVAISIAMIPVLAFWMAGSLSLLSIITLLSAAAIIFLLLYRFTTQKYWNNIKKRWLSTAIWSTTIVFGLLHLLSFTGFSLIMFPYMLSMCLVIFFAGCSIVYLRVNLGFCYGLAMHIFNNIPIIAFLLV